jgi:hypothetical protein
VLGGAQALAAGIMAVVTGLLYDEFGRTVAYAVCGTVMVVLVATGAWLARSAWSLTRPLHVDSVDDPVGPDPYPTPVPSTSRKMPGPSR